MIKVFSRNPPYRGAPELFCNHTQRVSLEISIRVPQKFVTQMQDQSIFFYFCCFYYCSVKPIGDGAHIYLAQRIQQNKRNNELAHFEEPMTQRGSEREK